VGFSISWLAVRGKEPAVVASSLGLKGTGNKVEYAEAMYTGRALPSGWFLLVINQCDHKFTAPASLSALSQGAEVIACSVEEHVMVSTSELWKAGRKVWRLEHNAQDSIDHLSESGDLPEAFGDIKRSLSADQENAGGKDAETDYFFDIPLTTSKSIVGFKHDEESNLEENSFEVFEALANSPRPWWKLW
jgi:hypothetical protein